MKEILDHIAARPGKVRVVLSAVTLETIAETADLIGSYDPSYTLIQATVGRSKVIGRYHVMDTNNPVMIFTADI
jgi:precorrin-6B methylase 2